MSDKDTIKHWAESDMARIKRVARLLWKTITWNIAFRMEYLICGENHMPREYWFGYSFMKSFMRNLKIYS